MAIGEPGSPATELYVEHVEDGRLVFVPVEIADEIVATRKAVADSETWGDLRAKLAEKRLDELHQMIVGGDDPASDGDPLDAPEDWPNLRYSEMTSWLPSDVVDDFGGGFSTMLDSGTNFDGDDRDEIEKRLRAAGISLRLGGPDLDELFAD